MAELEELATTLKEEEHERNKRVYEKKAWVLTIAYLVFQATAFVSITRQQARSSGQVQEQNLLWIPLVLSMLSTLIYLLGLLDIVSRFFWVGYQLELSFVEQGTVNKQLREAETHSIQIGESSSCKCN